MVKIKEIESSSEELGGEELEESEDTDDEDSELEESLSDDSFGDFVESSLGSSSRFNFGDLTLHSDEVPVQNFGILQQVENLEGSLAGLSSETRNENESSGTRSEETDSNNPGNLYENVEERLYNERQEETEDRRAEVAGQAAERDFVGMPSPNVLDFEGRREVGMVDIEHLRNPGRDMGDESLQNKYDIGRVKDGRMPWEQDRDKKTEKYKPRV